MNTKQYNLLKLKSLKGCRLSIGKYPHFAYNGNGGGGTAITTIDEEKEIQHVQFSPKTFFIPPMTWKNTRFLMLPLPPGLKIEMKMQSLEGIINKCSGEISLDFESDFLFTIFSLIHFPKLVVKTSLVSTTTSSSLFNAKGMNLQKNGLTTLVGIALIPVTGNKILDYFLGLPNEALAILHCKIE